MVRIERALAGWPRRRASLLAGAVAAAVAIALLVWGVRADRSIEIASASTRVLIDTPRSTLLDLRADTQDLSSLTNRAVLLGNLIAGPPVRRAIAEAAGVPIEKVSVTAPLTPEQPRAIAGSGHEPHTADLLAGSDEYRVDVQANPTVPMLDIDAAAPDAAVAERLADGAVDGLRSYLGEVAARQRTAKEDRVAVVQLGHAEGGPVNEGAGLGPHVVAFIAVVVAALALFLRRTRQPRGARAADTGHAPRRGWA